MFSEPLLWQRMGAMSDPLPPGAMGRLPRLRFDRHERAGAFFGDLRADLPLPIPLAVAAAVVGLPHGYAVGLVAGTAIAWAVRRGWVKTPSVGTEAVRVHE